VCPRILCRRGHAFFRTTAAKQTPARKTALGS
jgi:hypothetical protein